MPRGRLITIEGVDGAGKTTCAGALAEQLSTHGVDVRLLREPGGVAVAERVRELVKDPTLSVSPRAEALLYAAARAQLVEEAVEPALSAGRWVVLDRFVDSSLAYQGAGRELGVDQVAQVNAFATGGLEPDRTLLLEVDPATASARLGDRGDAPDRLEQAGAEFFERAAQAYAELAAADPGRIRVIDASEPADSVLAAAFAAVVDLLPSNP